MASPTSINKAVALCAIIFLLSGVSNKTLAEVYMSQGEFTQLASSLLNHEPQATFEKRTLWLTKDIQSHIKKILNHNYPKLRIRYLVSNMSGQNSVPMTIWFLEEIGKERPISFGVAVKDHQVKMIRVLEFRESRGYEIRIPAFAKQFENISVDNDGQLSRPIDGITGATMSVTAMKKISKVALLLHNIATKKISTPS